MVLLKRALATLVALILAVYLAACTWLYLNQEKLLFFPIQLPQDFQFEFPSEFEEVFLPTPDGETIHALYFKSDLDTTRGVMLMFHGNGEAVHLVGKEALHYTKRGFDVLVPDYRNYGKSSGELSEANLFADAVLMYDYLIQQRAWTSKDIFLYGRSLGTGIAAYVSSVREAEAIVLFAPYYSMVKLALENYPIIPSFVVRYPLKSFEYFAQSSAPIYAFHGTADNIIPVHHAQELNELLGDRMQLTLLEGGDHVYLMRFPEYWQNMDAALNRHFPLPTSENTKSN